MYIPFELPRVAIQMEYTYTEYLLSESYKDMAVQIIDSYHNYSKFIFNKQAPKVERLLSILSNELEKELSRIR